VIDDKTYKRTDLPRELEIQVLAFMRAEWGDALFSGDERYRDRLWDDPEALHFVRTAGNLLVSHVELLAIEAPGRHGDALHIAGVAGVMTYPPFRREGHASRLMRRVGSHIASSEADIGMLFTADDLESFYSSLGWSKLEPTRIRVHGRTPDNLVMTLGASTTLPEVVRLEQQW
jgi:predicted N-acetyltransferase YhbS